MAEAYDLGKKGEALAVKKLLDEGYQILERNYRYRKAEVDIIAINMDHLIGIEVKTRSTSDFGNPQDFVKPKQIELLVKAMNFYANIQDIDREIRFDIIAIILNSNKTEMTHIEDAFYHF